MRRPTVSSIGPGVSRGSYDRGRAGGDAGPTGGRAATLVLRHPNTNTKLER
jgi:hypothetical protein